MNFTKLTINNAESTVLNACRHFEEDPTKHGDEIFSVAQKKGYDYIRPYLAGLLEIAETAEAYSVAVNLSQPDWSFRKTNKQGYSALVIDTLTGEYFAGYAKEGDKCVLFDIPEDMEYTDETVDNPLCRKAEYAIKRKVWKNKGRYYVIAGSKSFQALTDAYGSAKVRKAPRWGFLGQFKAYLIAEGPFKSKQEAAANR